MGILDRLFKRRDIKAGSTSRGEPNGKGLHPQNATPASTNGVQVACRKCGAQILPSTARKYDGRCAPCASGRDVKEEERIRKDRDARQRARQRELELEWEHNLDGLPQRALLAFAGRCVRRIYSLLACFPMSDVAAGMHEVIQKTIAKAEVAAGGTMPVENADKAGSQPRIAYWGPQNGAYRAMETRFNLTVCRLALRAEECQTPGKRMSVQSIAEILVDLGYVCGANVGRPFPEEATSRLSSDLALLKDKALAGHWTDDTPVPATFFGPLWPNGVPKGWPA